MKNTELREVIVNTFKRVGLPYREITVNEMLPYVSVGDFYSQGDDCLELLRDANELARKTRLSYFNLFIR